MTTYLELKHLITLARAWSVDEALWILWVYQGEHTDICWQGYWTTPYEVEQTSDRSSLRPASRVKVKFYGGLNNTTEYRGCLSMFVIDWALRKWKDQNISWAWLLQFNPDATTHIKDQLGRLKPELRSQKLLPGFEDNNIQNHVPVYENGEHVIDYVEIGNDVYPIFESGRWGRVVQRKDFPIRAV